MIKTNTPGYDVTLASSPDQWIIKGYSTFSVPNVIEFASFLVNPRRKMSIQIIHLSEHNFVYSVFVTESVVCYNFDVENVLIEIN